MESAFHYDDGGFFNAFTVAKLASNFDGCFISFCTRVAEENTIHT
jgi:hypothetical protein